MRPPLLAASLAAAATLMVGCSDEREPAAPPPARQTPVAAAIPGGAAPFSVQTEPRTVVWPMFTSDKRVRVIAQLAGEHQQAQVWTGRDGEAGDYWRVPTAGDLQLRVEYETGDGTWRHADTQLREARLDDDRVHRRLIARVGSETVAVVDLLDPS